MDSRIIISNTGDGKLIYEFSPKVESAVPRQSVLWQRSAQPHPHSVILHVNMSPYQRDASASSGKFTGSHRGSKRHFLHLFWVNCQTVEEYRLNSKNAITLWLKDMREWDIVDWAIIVSTNADAGSTLSKRLSIARGSVFDKVRSDFGGKETSERILPLQISSQSSFESFLSQFRSLTIKSVGRYLALVEKQVSVAKHELHLPDWSFTNYFMYREEIASIYELLNLKSEALQQYDELDRHIHYSLMELCQTAVVPWLDSFSQAVSQWDFVSSNSHMFALQGLISTDHCEYLQLRSYLLIRQMLLLLSLGRSDLLLERLLQLISYLPKEMTILRITAPEGALQMWSLLTIGTILHYLRNIPGCLTEVVSPGFLMAHYTMFTTCISLGVSCGYVHLDPGLTARPPKGHGTFPDLLLRGINSYPSQCSENYRSILMDISTALKTRASYFEYALRLGQHTRELFKLSGKHRMATLVQMQMALICLQGAQASRGADELHHVFLQLSKYNNPYLVSSIALRLMNCYEFMGEEQKCKEVALWFCCQQNTKLSWIPERLRGLNRCMESEPKLPLPLTASLGQLIIPIRAVPLFWKGIGHIINNLSIELVLDWLGEQPAVFDRLSIVPHTKPHLHGRRPSVENSGRKVSVRARAESPASFDAVRDSLRGNSSPARCRSSSNLDRSASDCKDSTSGGTITRSSEGPMNGLQRLTATSVILSPGKNKLVLTGKLDSPGHYHVSMLEAFISQTCFKTTFSEEIVSFLVIDELPIITLEPASTASCIYNLEQTLCFRITNSSCHIPEGQEVCFQSPTGLRFYPLDHQEVTRMSKDSTVTKAKCSVRLIGDASAILLVPEMLPYDQLDFKLTIKTPPGSDDLEVLPHYIHVTMDWFPLSVERFQVLTCSFVKPFLINQKTFVTPVRNYLQILLGNPTDRDWVLLEVGLTVVGGVGDISIEPVVFPFPAAVHSSEEIGLLYTVTVSNCVDAEYLASLRIVYYQKGMEPTTTYVYSQKIPFSLQDSRTP